MCALLVAAMRARDKQALHVCGRLLLPLQAEIIDLLWRELAVIQYIHYALAIIVPQQLIPVKPISLVSSIGIAISPPVAITLLQLLCQYDRQHRLPRRL